MPHSYIGNEYVILFKDDCIFWGLVAYIDFSVVVDASLALHIFMQRYLVMLVSC